MSLSSCKKHTYDRIIIKKISSGWTFPLFCRLAVYSSPPIPLQPLHLCFGAYLGHSFICFYLAHVALGKNTDLVCFHQTKPITAPTFHLSPVLARTAAARNLNGPLSRTVYTGNSQHRETDTINVIIAHSIEIGETG